MNTRSKQRRGLAKGTAFAIFEDNTAAAPMVAEVVPVASTSFPTSCASVVDENSAPSAVNIDNRKREAKSSPCGKGEQDIKRTKRMEISVDEKTMNGAPEGDLYDIKVLQDEELSPLVVDDVGLAVTGALAASSLETSSWADKYAAVELIRCVVLFHKDALLGDAVALTASLELAIAAIESLRSCSVRNGILCLKAMASSLAAITEDPNHATAIMEALMNRSATGPRFVCDSASAAAKVAAERMSVQVLAQALATTMNHRNQDVSSLAFVFFAQCVLRQEASQLAEFSSSSFSSSGGCNILSILSRGINAKRPNARDASCQALQFLQKGLGEERYAEWSSQTLSASQITDINLATRKKMAVGKEDVPTSSAGPKTSSFPCAGARLSLKEQMALKRAQLSTAPTHVLAPAPAPATSDDMVFQFAT